MDTRIRRLLAVTLGIVAGGGLYYFFIADLPDLVSDCGEFGSRPRAYLLGLPAFLVFGLIAVYLSRLGGVACIITASIALAIGGFVSSSVIPNLIFQARECGPLQ